jgi:hypothetical protein
VVPVLIGLAVAGALAFRALRPRVLPDTALMATPANGSLSVRVGESLEFSAAAPGTVRFVWTLWDATVAEGPTWTYVPGPEDAGWQQVRVVATTAAGRRLERRWDIGVVPAVFPEIVELDPPPGTVAEARGEPAKFRCNARVPAARESDRLRFEWRLDDRVVQQEERSAAAGTSELVIAAVEAGTHRVSLRVSEDERAVSPAEWTLEVVAPPSTTVPPATTPPTTLPPATTPPTAPPTTAPVSVAPTTPRTTLPPTTLAAPSVAERPPARLVPSPPTRGAETSVGEPIVLRVRLEPETPAVGYDWTVDGRGAQRGASARFEYRPTSPGRHRVAVAAFADGRALAREEWIVTVAVPEPPPVSATPPPPVAAPAPPPGSPATTALRDDEVRRWLDDYARAWSRKDMDALRRMGQVRSPEEAEKLERYFRSVNDLHVDVRVRALHIDGSRALVEFERVDTVTDPAGRRQELRLPPLMKEIERTPEGLRFSDRGAG